MYFMFNAKFTTMANVKLILALSFSIFLVVISGIETVTRKQMPTFLSTTKHKDGHWTID